MYSEIFQIPVGTVTPLGGGLFLDPLPPKDMADILETTAPFLVVIFGTTNCYAMRAHYRKRRISRGMHSIKISALLIFRNALQNNLAPETRKQVPETRNQNNVKCAPRFRQISCKIMFLSQ